MSRMNRTLTMVGAAIAVAAAGWALSAMFPPASKKRYRHGVVSWHPDEQWRSAARASRRLLRRAALRASDELKAQTKRVADAVAAKVG